MSASIIGAGMLLVASWESLPTTACPADEAAAKTFVSGLKPLSSASDGEETITLYDPATLTILGVKPLRVEGTIAEGKVTTIRFQLEGAAEDYEGVFAAAYPGRVTPLRWSAYQLESDIAPGGLNEAMIFARDEGAMLGCGYEYSG